MAPVTAARKISPRSGEFDRSPAFCQTEFQKSTTLVVLYTRDGTLIPILVVASVWVTYA